MTLKIFAILLLALVVFPTQSQQSIGWGGIAPLKSTRADVERQLGPLDLICHCYKTGKEIVRVSYATDRCAGDLPGWDVQRDTVLSVSISPLKEIAFSDVVPNKEHFVKTMDDTFTAYYGDAEKGLRYAVSQSGFIATISYFPSINDNSRRCAGFPPTDGGITAYSPYEEFPYESLHDITSRIGEFIIRLEKEPTYKGYIVVYAGRDEKITGVATFASQARDYAIKEYDVAPKKVVAINGGYRRSSMVQLFIIPSSWPPPAPNPTFPGVLK
jgi:hypothetical protein